MDGINITTTPFDINADIMSAVRDSSTLADLKISMWGGVKRDKKRVEELKAQHGAVGKVGEFDKNLMTGADALLDATHSTFSACRTYHYQVTLPWVGNANARRKDGPRLLPNMLFDQYLGEMGKLRAAAMNALDAFVDAYPADVERAKANLAGMADDAYPSPQSIRERFNIIIDFLPIPDIGKSYTGLRPEMAERLQSILQQRHKVMIEGAQEVMWENVKEKVGHLVDRLKALAEDDTKPKGKPATRFHATNIDHVKDLLKLLPGWNIVGDGRVDEIVGDIKTMLDGVSAEIVKDSIGVRDDTLSKAQSVMEKLNGWGV